MAKKNTKKTIFIILGGVVGLLILPTLWTKVKPAFDGLLSKFHFNKTGA